MINRINLLIQPNQKLSCNLVDDIGNLYAVDINLRTLPDGHLIADIYIDNETSVLSTICCNKMPLVPTNTLNGNIYFIDMDGDSDPVYTGFENKYYLVYDTEFRLG